MTDFVTYPVGPLGLIAMPGTEELGQKINSWLKKWRDHAEESEPGDMRTSPGAERQDFLINVTCPRFGNGEAKGMIKELMTPDSCTGIQMMRLVIRPGGSTGETPYNHPGGAKCGTVLSGQLMLEVDGETHRLGTGDSFAFEATRMIRFWCGGSEPAEVLWIVTPAVY